MMALFSQAAGFGLAAGTSIGPLHTLLMNVTLAYGWRSGLLIALSPLATDIPIIGLMLLLISQLPPAFGPILSILGAGAVFFIAYRAWRELGHNAGADDAPVIPPPPRVVLVRGMTMNFLNPAPYIFWGTITGPLLRQAMQASVLDAALFLLAFYVPFIGLMVGFTLLFERVRRLNRAVLRGLSVFSVVLMAILGLSLLWSGLQGLAALQ